MLTLASDLSSQLVLICGRCADGRGLDELLRRVFAIRRPLNRVKLLLAVRFRKRLTLIGRTRDSSLIRSRWIVISYFDALEELLVELLLVLAACSS